MKKTHFLAVFVLFAAVIAQSQTTTIPDSNFEQALIDLGIDSDGTVNGEVLTADIENVTELDVSSAGISDLTGIEDFDALEMLDCSSNSLTSIDLNENSVLEWLKIINNTSLSSLDLSQNLELNHVNAYNANLESLDVTNLTELEFLLCEANPLSALDLSNNPNLEKLFVGETNITGLDLRNNPVINEIQACNMPNLSVVNLKNREETILLEIYFDCSIVDATPAIANTANTVCIEVDNETAANSGEAPYYWEIYGSYIFSENCSLGSNETQRFSFSVYPNPTSNTVTITTGNAVLQEVRVYTTTGKEVLHQKNNTSVDLSAMAPGVYFLAITTDLGRQVEKMVKE